MGETECQADAAQTKAQREGCEHTRVNIQFDKTELELEVGEQTSIDATITPEVERLQHYWATSNDKVETVDEKGNVTAVGNGTLQS